jgi:hypothetical protein
MNPNETPRLLRSLRLASASALIAALALAPRAHAQERVTAPPDASEQELKELFGKVERRLREIDKLLSDASAGETRKLDQVGASGIDEILKNASARHQEVLEGIDRILEIARELDQQQQSSSGQGGEPKPGGEGGQSPLDRRQGQSTEREETPSRPQGSGEPKQPKPGGEKPENGKQPEPQGDTPRDGRASPDRDPKNTPGSPQGAQPTDRTQRPGADQERWGDLPVHARDVFRTEGGGDMPVQYRDWIDAYYRRLNKKP